VISSFFSKPLVTPSTRFATWARAVPYSARARIGLDPRVHLHLAVLELHLDVVMDDELKLALRPLHLDGLPVDGRGHTRRNRNRSFANT